MSRSLVHAFGPPALPAQALQPVSLGEAADVPGGRAGAGAGDKQRCARDYVNHLIDTICLLRICIESMPSVMKSLHISVLGL